LVALRATAAQAAPDPLDPSYMPAIDTNPADYPSDIWITGPLAKVYQNAGSPGNVHWAMVYATQNEFQSFQVHVKAPAGGIANLNVAMSSLVNSQTGTTIQAPSVSATDIIVYREAYINVTQNTQVFAVPTQLPLGYIPDPLIPAIDPYFHQTTNAFPFTVAVNNNQSVWIDVHIPPTAPSGYYKGTVTVTGNGATLATMPVVYAVWSWRMPSTASLKTYQATGYGDFCNYVYGSVTACSAYPGSGGSGDYATGLAKIDLAVMMLDHRWSMGGAVYPPPSNVFTGFERDWGPLLNGTPAHTSTILAGAKLTALTYEPPGGLYDYTNLQAWQTEFQSKGWLSTLFTYTSDEPGNNAGYWATINTRAASIHATSPIAKSLVTTNLASPTTYGGLNSVDWMVPIINDLEPGTGSLRSTYDAWLAGGCCGAGSPTREIWTYVSNETSGTNGAAPGPTNPQNYYYPQYQIDGTPVANRALEWVSYLDNLTGELYYYSTLCYGGSRCAGPVPNDPWVSSYNQGTNGDGMWVYPGSTAKVGTPIPIWVPSMRLKMVRDGQQDYEYLHALANAGLGAFATQQAHSWMTAPGSFSNDPAGLTSARQALGTKLHQLGLQSSGPSPCDVNGDGAINVADVQLEVNMALGISPCTNASGTCTVVSVQRVVNAALGGACVAP
jgi:hypothetical protein